MTSKLRISDALSLPLDAVTSTLIVYGGKGMGKTNFGSVLVEELHRARRRFAVLDPVGVWHGVQFAADGKGPGLEVLILGGKHGDIPIEPTGGAVVADLVADEDVDVVVDISRRADGTMWSVGERIRFVADYCTRLYQRQGERRRPLMQVIDEAGRFVPQQIPHGSPDIAKCVGAIEQLVELGRNVAVGVTLITQRSARMNKSVSELADCMIAFRTIGPRSVDSIVDWLGENVEKARWKEIVGQLRSLPRGSALVISPGWLEFEGVVEMRARETFDSSATPTGGGERKASGRGAKPDLTKYRDRMAETIERAKSADPKEITRKLAERDKKIAELERQLRARVPEAPAVQTKTRRVEVPVLTGKERQALERFAAGVDTFAASMAKAAVGVRAALVRFDDAHTIATKTMNGAGYTSLQPVVVDAAGATITNPKDPRLRAVPRKNIVLRERQAQSPGDQSLKRPQRVVLTAIAQWEDVHHSPMPKQTLAATAGYSTDGGGFNNLLSRLRVEGLVAGSDPIGILGFGRTALGSYEELPSRGPELLDFWKRKLRSKAHCTILDVLAERGGVASKVDVAEAAGYAVDGGGFNNALSRLRVMNLIEGRDQLSLQEALR